MARRISFLVGLLLGSSLCAWLLGAVLVYLFTGQVLSLQTGSGGIKIRLQDLSFSEVLPREEA
jgi:hypothetical protein